MFRDGIREFAENLGKAGVPVHAMEEAGMFHVFPILMPWAEASKDVLRDLRTRSARNIKPDPQAKPTH